MIGWQASRAGKGENARITLSGSVTAIHAARADLHDRHRVVSRRGPAETFGALGANGRAMTEPNTSGRDFAERRLRDRAATTCRAAPRKRSVCEDGQ